MNGNDAITNKEAAVFEAVRSLLAAGRPVRAAIDGNAAAGKSTFAAALAARFGEEYTVNLFHMDDFFLPPALRTPERLREPGGNVHYERFEEEVLPGLMGGAAFSYGVFDCRVMEVTHSVPVEPAQLSIVEGAYSMHPRFGSPYDIRIFFSATPKTQSARILARNGAMMLERFETVWIPMENAYFHAFRIPEGCDFILRAEELERPGKGG